MPDEISLNEQVRRIILTEDARGAFRLIKELDATQRVTTNDREKDSIARVMARLRAMALKFARDATIEELFEKYPLEVAMVMDDVDVISNLRSRIGEEVFLEDRSALRDSWRAAIERSSQKFGTDTVRLGKEDVPSTVANWIRLYVSQVGTGRASTVQIARFFSQDSNVQQLSETARMILRHLIEIYEFLKLRSTDIEGYEESEILEDGQGNLFIVDDGTIQPFYDQNDLHYYENLAKQGKLSLARLVDLSMKFPDQFDKYKMPPIEGGIASTPEQDEESMRNFIAGQKEKFVRGGAVSTLPVKTDELVALFLKSTDQLDDQNIQNTKAVLQKIAMDRNQLRGFLNQETVKQFIGKGFPAKLGKKNKELVARAGFHPVGFQALLQIVYLNKFELSEEEALWHSFEIVRKFPLALKEFKTIVAFDISKGKLIWKY